MSKQSLAADLVDGPVADAIATWATGPVTTGLYDRESEEVRDREGAARDGKTAYGIAAEKGAELVGSELSDEQEQRFGAVAKTVLRVPQP